MSQRHGAIEIETHQEPPEQESLRAGSFRSAGLDLTGLLFFPGVVESGGMGTAALPTWGWRFGSFFEPCKFRPTEALDVHLSLDPKNLPCVGYVRFRVMSSVVQIQTIIRNPNDACHCRNVLGGLRKACSRSRSKSIAKTAAALHSDRHKIGSAPMRAPPA